MLKSLLRMSAMAAFLLLIVVCQATLTLAGTTATINGRVTDELGRPVSGAHVSVVAPSFQIKTTTGSNGFYAVTGLPPDTYGVTFAEEGYITQTVAGITVNQDQTYVQNLQLLHEVKTIGRIPVRGALALVQPTQTVNQYTINSQSVQNITGTPQNISETAVLNALPGITTDNGGYPIIRGGAENDEGFELEGIDATEPITGQFINSLVLNGVGRLQLSTGGYDVSEGNTNSGVVNVLAKRGVFPGSGQATARVGWPAFDHRLAFDYGNATPDNRFSYYISYNGDRNNIIYGDGKTFLPRLLGQVDYESGDDLVLNFFYHWGANNANELQYFGDAGANLFNERYQINPAVTPYASNNGVVQAFTGGLIDFVGLFPGQAGLFQNTNYPDHEDENHQIQKINFKHQFSASSFAELRVFRTLSTVNFLLPWDGGAFGDVFEFDVSDNRAVAFDYSNQLSSQHDVSFGGETIFTKPTFSIAIPSIAPFVEPLEFGYIQGIIGDPTLPLTLYPPDTSFITDTLHRNNLWLKDRWQPSSRWTATVGLRWDQEVFNLPSNAGSQNLSYATTATCAVSPLPPCVLLDVPGQPIGPDVTRPSLVSPRIALAYQASGRDAFKASYGKFIEFTPFSNIENTYQPPAAAAACTIANGCFAALPGYSPTCVNGLDPANANARCNGINNLRQQIIGDLNSFFFAQYTPVRPQRATSADFSWEHDFGNGLQLKITPYYRKGTDYVVASTPLLFNLPDGTSVFGSPRESNAGINLSTGVEFALARNVTYGLSGFINGTYDNTLANYNSDFFPSVNQAAVDLGHLFRVSYLAPVTATGNVTYNTRGGFHVFATFPYESGYYYGVGRHTFVYLPTGPNGTLQPHEVLNTDLAATALGLNSNTSAYYFTDPTNPGTILSPNITGSRGTNEGTDPGSIRGPQRLFWNMTVAHDIGSGAKNMQVGFTVNNLLGNYSNGVVGGNSRYRNNGFGGYSNTSGNKSGFLAANEPYQFDRSPFPFESEATGRARTFIVYWSAKY